MHINRQCVVYITDKAFLFPTLLSASQARKYTQKSTDVLVLLTESTISPHLMSIADFEGIQLRDISKEIETYLAPLRARFTSRISVSTMGRLLVQRYLPGNYNSVIYIDGDTQVISSLLELEKLEVPDGKFYACLDPMDVDHELKTGRSRNYFNAGLLKFNPSNWPGEEAFEYYCSNIVGQFHDQEALNIIGGNRVILLSSRWNFPKQYLHLVPLECISIIHFMAHPKPWHGAFFPCNREFNSEYQKFLKRWPSLKSLCDSCGMVRYLLYSYRSIRDRVLFFTGIHRTVELQRVVLKMLKI